MLSWGRARAGGGGADAATNTPAISSHSLQSSFYRGVILHHTVDWAQSTVFEVVLSCQERLPSVEDIVFTHSRRPLQTKVLVERRIAVSLLHLRVVCLSQPMTWNAADGKTRSCGQRPSNRFLQLFVHLFESLLAAVVTLTLSFLAHKLSFSPRQRASIGPIHGA